MLGASFLEGHLFEVWDKGRGRFAYVVADNAYQICLNASETGRLPLASVQISSELLTCEGVEAALAPLDEIITALQGDDSYAKVSRADLCVDFVCGYPLEEISPRAWVRRVDDISWHFVGRRFSGVSFGGGGEVVARLYDKTLELKDSGKEYLIPFLYH